MREELFGADSEGEEDELEQQPEFAQPEDAYAASQDLVRHVSQYLSQSDPAYAPATSRRQNGSQVAPVVSELR